MELDLISKSYPCRSQNNVAVLNSRGGIHYGPVEVAQKNEDRPRGFIGSYAWFNAETLSRELEAIGEKKKKKEEKRGEVKRRVPSNKYLYTLPNSNTTPLKLRAETGRQPGQAFLERRAGL